jgi:hypothetical protein
MREATSVADLPPLELLIDELFDELLSPAPVRAQRYRDHLPTLRDADPLRYDIGYRRERDASRDSLPTLPDIDPLRHDLPS